MDYKRFPLGPLSTNTYLVWEGDSGFVTDPAGDGAGIQEFAEKEGITVKKILITHGHMDHVGGIPDAAARFGAPLYIHRDDAPMLENPDQDTALWMGYDFGGTEDFTRLKDGDVLEVGSMSVQVISTPGHTRGSVCFLVRSEKGSLLVSGDTLFARSVGRTDLPGGDPLALDRSLVRLASLPDGLAVLPGHGPETTIGAEKAHNPFWPEDRRGG
ncbi:MAG: MBL fold metallo-hydrolase [Synergistaceae bacterium]|nr:MBL fold metallo-hydrolase [Synergistaceae bacterium]